jgi:hypothetical protein
LLLNNLKQHHEALTIKNTTKIKTMKKQIIKEDSLGNFSFENIKKKKFKISKAIILLIKKKFKISKAIILLILPIFIFIFSCKEQKTEPPLIEHTKTEPLLIEPIKTEPLLIEPIKTEPTLLEVYKKDTDNLKIFIFKQKTLFSYDYFSERYCQI